MMLTKLALFAGGMLFGTAGLKILSSRDAKKVYAHTAAAVIRAKDSVMETVSAIRENADDILADAKAINASRCAEEGECVVEDCSSPCGGPAEDKPCCCNPAEEPCRCGDKAADEPCCCGENADKE